jgi:hypothetical protein
MTTWFGKLSENRAQLDDLMRAREALIVSARLAGSPISAIAEAAGISRMQVHRILNDKAPTLRLVGPDPDGMWSDSTGERRSSKPEWLVAAEGSGAVRGWYFEADDATVATGEGEYSRHVEHISNGKWE